jgi:hypothetical protein
MKNKLETIKILAYANGIIKGMRCGHPETISMEKILNSTCNVIDEHIEVLIEQLNVQLESD